ncbi:hypothetical protein SISSUDRAFT_1042473 [Sistotremastrum suecicum HHB10207 ss-3]|uniref:Uncharacterized protein n=1 Tax=Sistotremastrum suecicum HHB10207 ss-3 TaxID=1314776 RepID=A0A166GHL8_9AGAM|nr:hypothetical protein SISSUDRAFT_1042473 [Sistotremastrum suecicum HHB10207 ss-3]
MKRRAESRGESKRPRTLPLPPPNPSPEDNPFTLSSFSSLVQLSTHAQSLASSSSLPRINKSIPLLRAVLAECSSILSTHPDPSVLFAPPRSPPASIQSPTSLTPPDERLLRDWGPNPPHPPHSNSKSVEYQPNAFHSLYASSLFYYGYILHHHPSLFEDMEDEEHSAKEYLEAALHVFQASDSIQSSSSYSHSHSSYPSSSSHSYSGEDWQTTINWGRTIVALTLLNPRLCNVTTEDANSTPTPRVHSPNEREGQEQERLGADGGGGLFPPRPHSHLDPAPSSVTSPSPMSNPKIITSDSVIGTGTGTTGTTNTSTSAGTNTGTDVDMNVDVNIVNMDMDIDQAERSLPTPSPLPRLSSLPLSSTSTSGQGTSTQSLPELPTLRRLKSKSKRVKAKEIPLPHSLPIILPLPESSLPPLPLPLPLPSTTSPFAYTPTPTSSSFSSSFTFPPSSNTQDVLTIQPTFNPLAPRDDGTVGGGEWREADGREVEQIPSESHTLLSLATDTLTRGIFHLPSSSSPSPSLRLRRWRVLERVARDVGGVASNLRGDAREERKGRAEWAAWAAGVLEMVKSEIESAPPLPPQDPTPTPGSDTTMIKREEEEDISMEEHQHEREGEQDDEEDDKEEDYQTSLESLKDRIEQTYTHCCLVIASASHAEATLDNRGSPSSPRTTSSHPLSAQATAATTATSSPSLLPSLSNLPSLTASGFQLLPTSSMSASLYRSFSSGSDLPLYTSSGGASSSAGAAGIEAREGLGVGLGVDAGEAYEGRRRSIVSIADLPPLDQTDAPDTEERKGDEAGRDFRMDHPRKGEGGPISPHSRGRREGREGRTQGREGRLRVESYLPSPPSSSTPPSVPISLALDAEADVSAATAIDKGEEVRFPTAEEIKESVDREDEKSLDAGSKAGGKKTPSPKLAKGRQTRKRKRSSIDTAIAPLTTMTAGDATPLNTVATTQAGDGGKDGDGVGTGNAKGNESGSRNANGSTRVLRPRTRDRKRSKQAL